jgi:hypothetical protein
LKQLVATESSSSSLLFIFSTTVNIYQSRNDLRAKQILAISLGVGAD